jgi:hypothetical protein
VHTTSAQEPECQDKKGHCPDEHDACKPDFDEKDSKISPHRKAPGPDKAPRNQSPASEEKPPEPAPVGTARRPPEASIEEDLPPESES